MTAVERMAELNVWAEAFTPDRPVTPPAWADAWRPTEDELLELFAGTLSARAHLALIDRRKIRRVVERTPRGSALRQAVRSSWMRHYSVARKTNGE